MPELLADIQRQLTSRLGELRPLVREAEQLERALAALNATDDSRSTSSAPRSRTSSTRRRSRAVDTSPRGATVARVVDYLRAHPRSTAGDVAAALKMNRRSTSTRLTQLARAGTIKKESRGYSA